MTRGVYVVYKRRRNNQEGQSDQKSELAGRLLLYVALGLVVASIVIGLAAVIVPLICAIVVNTFSGWVCLVVYYIILAFTWFGQDR